MTASSSTEAEFIAACDAGKTARHLRFVLQELGFPQEGSTEIHIDDQAAVQITNDNQCPTVRTRHLDIRWFSSQLDINTNLLYNDKIWGGLSYRLDDGVVILAGLELMKDLRLGLAYDLVVSKIGENSFEVMLGYNFDIKVDTQIKRYKNPRFL